MKESKHVYGVIELITCVLSVVFPGSSWRAKVDHLVESSFIHINGRKVTEMGYPER